MLILKKCKICRRLGQKALLNQRCASNKCAFNRRKGKPGMHSRKRRTLSQYGKELAEKQKIKYFYLLKEKQLKRLVKNALAGKESAPDTLARMLERKLLNVIWLAGYVASKTAGRQLISHGHFLVNGKKIKSHNYMVEPYDIIEINERSRQTKIFQDLNERLKNYVTPAWIKFDAKTFKAEILRLPELEEINLPVNLNLVIDFYSRH
jgi:small subunit ribosomal protein S4